MALVAHGIERMYDIGSASAARAASPVDERAPGVDSSCETVDDRRRTVDDGLARVDDA